MRALTLTALLAVALTSVVQAQQGQMRQRQRLQQQVMQRYMLNYKQQAGLSEDQFQKFTEMTGRTFSKRTELREQERTLWQALEEQMRPGIAANPDSLTLLMDEIVEVQAQIAEAEKENQRELEKFLTPVQRAQLMLSQRRLQLNIEEIMRQRQQERQQGGGN
jgi:hypothetical protein